MKCNISMRPGAFLKVLVLTVAGFSFFAANGQGGYRDDPTMPSGKTGERIKEIIAALNSNDPEKIRQLVTTAFTEGFANMAPMEGHIDAFTGVYRQTGGIDFHSIRSYDPPKPQTVVIVRDRLMGGWFSFSFELEKGSEGRIAGLGFSPARTPTDVQEPPLNEAQVVAEVNKLTDKLCQKDAFSGTLLIAKGDKVLLERVCGEADKSYHVANNPDTKFNLGSMNKMFTATAIVQLVEKGVLSFDDPISKYVDESWLPRSITDKVTIHHLLTHTSGLGSYFNDTYWRSSRELYRRVDDYKPLVQGDTLAFDPGARYQYSNTGMLLLGVVIEKATQQDYFDYIREHVYVPAGMTNTDCYELDYPIENLAIGYIPDPHSPYKWQTNTFKHVLRGGPAGGGYSTVRDLHRFARALQTGKLVSKVSLDRMWTSQSEGNYGYGFDVRPSAAGKITGHSGGFPGLNSDLKILVDRGYIIAVMSNYDSGASPFAERIVQLLVRMPDK